MRNNYKKFNYKHSLGQNFIVDEFLLDDIVSESGINKDDFILEIGPGNGAMTKVLCENAKSIVAIEIDKSLIPLLNSNLKDYKNMKIINDDFLKIDFNKIIDAFVDFGFDKNSNHIKVVANLPYYITSPIINNLFFNPYISEMTLMVQKEVAERITAVPGGKEYGVLTLACNYFSNTEMLMIVSKNCFYPVPKVDSAVVKFIKHEKFLDVNNQDNFHIEENIEYKKLFELIKSAFSQRRKKLLNSLTNAGFDKETLTAAFSKLNLDENVRAEGLSLGEYIMLKNLL